MTTRDKQLSFYVFLAAVCVAPVAIGNSQTVPVLGGAIETLWTSDRTSWLEGPGYDGVGGIWFGDPGNILSGFGEPSRLLRHDIGSGQTTIEIDTGVDPNVFGTAFDSEGRLIATHLDQIKLTRRETSQLSREEVIEANFMGLAVLPNDLVLDASGGIYLTDWKQNTPPELGDSGVYYLAPDSNLLQRAVSVPRLQSANGIAIAPDNDTVYVARPFGGGVYAYDVISPGKLGEEPQFFAPAPTGVDGITVDRHGNVYVPQLGADPATGAVTPGLPDATVSVFSPAGDLLLQFAPPGGAINLTFDDQDNLYMTGWNVLTRVPVTYVPEPSSHLLRIFTVLAILFISRRRRHARLAKLAADGY